MVWTTPQTWVAGLVTVDDFNEQIRDNLAFLKDPPTDIHTFDDADWSSTSTSFVDVDATDLALTISTGGGDVMVGFTGTMSNAGGRFYLELDVDGSPAGGEDGIFVHGTASTEINVAFTYIIEGLSAASHTIKLQWKVSAGTVLLRGGNTANYQAHPQFWAREVS